MEAQCSGLHCLFSNKVTPEARITGTAQLLPLGKPEDWACAAICCAGLRNKNAAAEVAEAGYDINGASGAARWILSEKIKIVNRNYLTSLHSCVIIIKALL